jgi:hypothetical protein
MGWGVSRSVVVGLVAGLTVTLVLALLGPGASARATYSSPYGYERTWNAALRFVRVDNGWKLLEKDEAGGYLLFEYTVPGAAKPTSGSIELVRGREGTTQVDVLVQLPQMPHYHEQVLIDALSAKMRREYGDPPPAPPRKAPAPPSDESVLDGGDG